MMTRPKPGVASAPAILSLALLLSACAPPSPPAIAIPPAPSETPLTMSAATDPATESPPIGFTQDKLSLPACSVPGFPEDIHLDADSRDWLAEKAALLADRLPGFLGEFAKEGIQFGEGALTPLQGALSGLIDEEVSPVEGFIEEDGDPASGFRFYLVAHPPHQPDGTVRLALGVSSGETADTSGGDGETPAPTPLASPSVVTGPFASVRVEILDATSRSWIPICEDLLMPESARDASASGIPTGNAPRARVLQNASCRRGPATVFDVVVFFELGDNLQIVGQNEAATWWQVSVPGDLALCWIASTLVEPLGTAVEVPVAISPPFPTDTEVPSSGGSQKVGCFYLRVCNPYPCGRNTPGGVPCYY